MITLEMSKHPDRTTRYTITVPERDWITVDLTPFDRAFLNEPAGTVWHQLRQLMVLAHRLEQQEECSGSAHNFYYNNKE